MKQRAFEGVGYIL